MPTTGGEARMAGGATARRLDPEMLERAQRAVERADARVSATARYDGGRTRVRLAIAVPYEAPEGERTATYTLDIGEDGHDLDRAFDAFLETHLPELVRLGKRAAAEAMIAAERDAPGGN